MTWPALAIALGLVAAPAFAEPYRPLPRYPDHRVRQRAASARAAQKLHLDQASRPAAPFASRERPTAAAAQVDEVHVIAIPPLSKARRPTPARRPSVGSAPPAAPALPAELKMSLTRGGAEGRFLVLVDAPPGARIELTLDEGGRLLDVRPSSRGEDPSP
jgi:hypothetical protein